MGVNVRRAKLLAFALGASFAWGAGSFFASRTGFVSPESFTFVESILVVCIVVIGGSASEAVVSSSAEGDIHAIGPGIAVVGLIADEEEVVVEFELRNTSAGRT